MSDDCHFKKLDWDKAISLLGKVNEGLADGMRRLRIASKHKGKTEQLPGVCYVEYDYGSSIVGTTAEDGRTTRLLAPAHPDGKANCPECESFLRGIGNQLPIGVVLNNSAEVYVEYERGVRYSAPFVPLRILRPGDAFGIFEFLDSLRGAESRTQWRISSGARSVFLCSPLRNAAIAKRLQTLCAWDHSASRSYGNGPRRSSLKGPEPIQKLAAQLDTDSWRFIRMILDLAKKDRNFSPQSSLEWKCSLLLICPNWLRSLATVPHAAAPASQLIHLIKDIGWAQSEHLRRFPSYAAELAGILSEPLPDDDKHLAKPFEAGYLHRTLLHLLSISHGDLPGFTPVTATRQDGPFQAAMEYLVHSELWFITGLEDRFLLLLQPHQLGANGGIGASAGPLYYSLETPTLLGPIQEFNRSPQSFMTALHQALCKLQEASFSLFNLEEWKLVTTQTIWESADATIIHNMRYEHFRTDFGDQFRLHEKLLGEKVVTRMLTRVPELKNTFLTRCIRLRAGHDSAAARDSVA